LLSSFSFFFVYQQYRKRRHRLLRVVEFGDRHDRPSGKDVLGAVEPDIDPAQHKRESRPEINTPASRHARIMREGYFLY